LEFAAGKRQTTRTCENDRAGYLDSFPAERKIVQKNLQTPRNSELSKHPLAMAFRRWV
jgi:hypothetical protein